MIDPHFEQDLPVTTARILRQFAGLCLLFGGSLATWQWLVRDEVTVMAMIGGGFIVAGAIGLISPEWIRPLYSGLLALTIPIGRVVSLVLLAALFYLVFTPIGVFFRLIGRDALDRRRPNRATHWTSKRMPTDPRSYLRQ